MGNPTDMQNRPVFIFAIHRSGGTLLTRLLNCHPDLVIWGEHAGFINKLADADFLIRSCSDALPEHSVEELHRYFAFGEDCQRDFSPWMNPFASSEFGERCRDLLLTMYSRGQADKRWGFKEIRYHRPLVAAFLQRLFPEARFILLVRDPIELCISNVLVDWSLERVLARGGGNSRASFLEVVEDCLYAIVAIRSNFAKLEEMIGTECIIIHYEHLINAPLFEYRRVLDFLQLQPNPLLFQNVKNVLESVTGATLNRQTSTHPLLNEQQIRSTCASLLDGVVRKIREEGIDRARLMGTAQKGRFSFLLGDLSESEPHISSMF
jgi:hypothetical protein